MLIWHCIHVQVLKIKNSMEKCKKSRKKMSGSQEGMDPPALNLFRTLASCLTLWGPTLALPGPASPSPRAWSRRWPPACPRSCPRCSGSRGSRRSWRRGSGPTAHRPRTPFTKCTPDRLAPCWLDDHVLIIMIFPRCRCSVRFDKSTIEIPASEL